MSFSENNKKSVKEVEQLYVDPWPGECSVLTRPQEPKGEQWAVFQTLVPACSCCHFYCDGEIQPLNPSNLETFHISVLPLQILTVMLFCTHLSVSHVCHFSLHFLSSISAFSTSGSELYSSSAALSGGDVGCAQHCVCLHVSCWVHPCSAHVPAGVHICKQYTVHATHVAVCMFVCRGCDPRAWWWWELYLGGERTTFLLGLPASREWQMKQKNRITCTDISPELESSHKGGWRKE